ncbi:MAG: flagellar biosynthesis protein FlhF [Pseudomonadota bacterium]
MKIKRFLAPTMREALKAVRLEQGPDAVILSNQRVGDYVEIIAALDYDEALINQALRKGVAGSASAVPSAEADNVPEEDIAEPRLESADDAPSNESPPGDEASESLRSLIQRAERANTTTESRRIGHAHVTGIEIVDSKETELSSIREEIGNMRALLEARVAGLKWQEKVTRDPSGAQMQRNLVRLGIASDIAAHICNEIDVQTDLAGHTWRQPISALSSALPATDDRLLKEGGIAAFVGPTGVGKTTTIAKIASRFAVQQGARDIALVSMDSYRIGAQEQLRTFGRIINASVFEAADAYELSTVLEKVADYRLVLIDTEGVSQRDSRLVSMLDGLGNQKRSVDLYLTLSATADEDVLDETVRQYSQSRIAGCVLTKIDEASRLGSAISVMIRNDLPLTYLTDGQRVPDDLHVAETKRLWLMHKALDYASDERFLPLEKDMAQHYLAMERANA